ncbi:hypothetical protein [Caldisalinibacter kiritimatiensis]|uniref:Uncharacterized protein n=1 Tax=Caldisalinibacter kiritimatiensis TaxID=1304284 RepID=R1AVY4_9FIRM|nr:hypothetical protein [Caldisalinibacter kiritimatiensis]EOD00807.1 hypothetical protein L21TH_1137 [Caldisalinibacter kiritimatiensis]
MKEKVIIIISMVVLIALTVFTYMYNDQKNKVDLKIIDNTVNLSDKKKKWIDSKEKSNGIHIYKTDHSDSFELLILFNKNHGKNLYVNTEANAKIVKGKLIVNFIDKLAIDDVYVNNKLIVNLSLDSKPKKIEVYYNGKKQEIVIETLD